MSNENILEFRVTALERVAVDTANAIKSIDSSLKTLTTLEVHHNQTRESLGRAFGEINDHETRLRRVEDDLPTLRLVRNWVIAGVIGCVTLIGVAVVGLVIANKQPPVDTLQAAQRR